MKQSETLKVLINLAESGVFLHNKTTYVSKEFKKQGGMDAFRKVVNAHKQFCEEAFPNISAVGSFHHAIEEVKEVIEDMEAGSSRKKVVEELSDVFFCLLAGMDCAGIELHELAEPMLQKLKVNVEREWKDNVDGSYSHIKQ